MDKQKFLYYAKCLDPIKVVKALGNDRVYTQRLNSILPIFNFALGLWIVYNAMPTFGIYFGELVSKIWQITIAVFGAYYVIICAVFYEKAFHKYWLEKVTYWKLKHKKVYNQPIEIPKRRSDLKRPR